jgi:Holliday junction resolvase
VNRWASAVDANQAAVVEALRKSGVYVIPTHRMGKGFPDLVTCYRGQIVFLEVKDGTKAPSAQALTADEVRFIADCSRHGVQVHVVKSEEEALAAVGVGVTA